MSKIFGLEENQEVNQHHHVTTSAIGSNKRGLDTTAIMYGTNDAGLRSPLSSTAEGHLEVAIHAPRLPFGSIHTERLHPVFQADAVYGVNTGQNLTTASGSGTVTASNSSFLLQTGATIYSQASLQSRRRLRYRPGQGVIARFTACFTSPVDNSYQVAGCGTSEDGVYFGYKNLQFGILYSSRGVREIQTLTITAASTHTENVTVTLGGVAHSIPVTNSGNIGRTAYEISLGTYSGWKASVTGSTVVFVADSVGNKTGTFSIAGTSATGTFAETKAGAAATEVFIPQTQWNGEKLDGDGTTGFTLDPTKYNVYQIKIQYLGAGAIIFEVEVAPDGNNPDFVVVHSIPLPNTVTETSFGNPAFPFTAAVYSAGSTANLTLKIGSYAGFIEGEAELHGNRFSYFNQSTTVTAASYHHLFTIQNIRTYANRANQSVVYLKSMAAACKHNAPVTIYILRNVTLVGNPSFSSYSSESCTHWDATTTLTATISDNKQIVWSGQMGETGNIDFDFTEEEITIQPGESISVVAKTSFGTASYVLASLNTREDQ